MTRPARRKAGGQSSCLRVGGLLVEKLHFVVAAQQREAGMMADASEIIGDFGGYGLLKSGG